MLLLNLCTKAIFLKARLGSSFETQKLGSLVKTLDSPKSRLGVNTKKNLYNSGEK